MISEVALPFAEIISKSQNVVLTCHVNADGDALGSTLGLRKILLNMGKNAVVITPDLAPTCYSWMPGFKTLKAYERNVEECDVLIDAADLIVMMDFNELSRIKLLGEKLLSCNYPRVLIDHHLAPQVVADVALSVPEASATCQLAYSLVVEAGLEQYMDVDVVSNFYTGIMTDTGGLSYNSSSPELYMLIADMLRRGIDKNKIHDKIFCNKTMRRLKLQGFALSRKLHRVNSMPITIIALSASELEQFNYSTGDTEGFVNMPLQIRDVIVSCLILERPDCIKMSFRSKGEFPVNEYSAKYFGGGGHQNAAGGTFRGSLDDAVSLYQTSIVDFYTRWMKKTANK